MTLTLDQHAVAVRREPGAMNALVDALKSDPDLLQHVRERLAHYEELKKFGRLDGCWISRTTNETLTAALAKANLST